MRGMTLIEVMSVVALLGIATALAGGLGGPVNDGGLTELQRERAAQVLEYQAERLASGEPVNAATMKLLTASLPGATVRQEREKATTRLVISWEDPSHFRHDRSLLVFARADKR